MNTIKGLVDAVSSEVTTLYVGGDAFSGAFNQLVGKSVRVDLLAKCNDIKAYCDQVKAAGGSVVASLAATT